MSYLYKNTNLTNIIKPGTIANNYYKGLTYGPANGGNLSYLYSSPNVALGYKIGGIDIAAITNNTLPTGMTIPLPAIIINYTNLQIQNFTVPDWARYVVAIVTGAGGGGGGAPQNQENNTGGSGGGGASGGVAVSNFIQVTPGGSYSIKCGSGGVPGGVNNQGDFPGVTVSNGLAGGNSEFGYSNYNVVGGGGGGANSGTYAYRNNYTNGNVGTAGSYSGNSINNTYSNNGIDGTKADYGTGGAGASIVNTSTYTAYRPVITSTGGAKNNVVQPSPGAAATGYGAGGAGGAMISAGNNLGAQRGGYGSNGYVQLFFYP